MTLQRVLLAHNYYREPGGEDQVFANEGTLLEQRGHRVTRFTMNNDALEGRTPTSLAAITLWNRATYRRIRDLIRQERPDIVHFHNTFPLISPAAYYAAKAEGVAVVQTLHNYRLLCPNALFFRDGKVCEDCLGKRLPWPGVVHACYRDSYTASAGAATMLVTHRLLRTWMRQVDVYLALSQFARSKFVEGGLPVDKLLVKPNFVDPDPGVGTGPRDYALFVGRLSDQKGIGTLLDAWERLESAPPLVLVGAGPLEADVVSRARKAPTIRWLGSRPREDVSRLMGGALAVILPSGSYENFPMVVAEAYAHGTPVVASDLGALAELVEHGTTGLRFRRGDAADLAEQVRWAATHPEDMRRMGGNARREYEAKYTADQNYRVLTEAYEVAGLRAGQGRSSGYVASASGSGSDAY
jgi:glycosyltransferase involved in cell wall biosynthesis